MARYSRLPDGGMNLFQEIKAKCAEVERQGMRLLKLSIGQPQGPALLSARTEAAQAVMNDAEAMHEYQDNGSPGVPDFCRRFLNPYVPAHAAEDADFLPIPGIKPMLGLLPLACNCANEHVKIATTTKPGYPTPRVWSEYLGVAVEELPLNPENAFRFSAKEIDKDTDLVMMNYPHNPTGQIATREWLEDICAYCEQYNIRLFNDAAYIALSHTFESCALAQVAIGFPDLSWAEAFSASKLIGNGTGWRIGAMVGSPDFIGDLKTIKGNTDSGFVAPMAAGALAALENDHENIEKTRKLYQHRLSLLVALLQRHKMRLAVQPQAGFFTLWKTPTKAFGRAVQDARDFNFLMIENAGVVGVHFDPYIRYAVCADVGRMLEYLDTAFAEAAVSY